MPTIAGLPYVPLRFKKDGTRAEAGPIRPSGVSDLIVISHGWHQDPDDAEGMYTDMLVQFQVEREKAHLYGDRAFGVTGIYWPSDQFRDDLSLEAVAVLGDRPAAALAATQDSELKKLKAQARRLANVLGLDEQTLSDQATLAATGGEGDADDLVRALRKAFGDPKDVDPELRDEHAELLDPNVKGRSILQGLKSAGPRGRAASLSGGSGAAALGLSGDAAPALGIFSGPVAAVATLLNQVSYFALKRRAGMVGAALGKLLNDDGLGDVQRLHLVGHSFGARLVTSATSAMEQIRPHSLTLLQGAFSHNALGVNIRPGLNGAYRNVVANSKVNARIVVTHTWNDHAVGVAYAIASRASNDVAAGLIRVTETFGGKLDIHGGMGANGALRLQAGEGTDQPLDGALVPPLGAGVCSVHCDFIKSHSDIRTPEVARVLLAAVK